MYTSPSSRLSLRARRWSWAPLLAVFALFLGPLPSATAAVYQYWSYWQVVDGAWAFATTGPAEAVPADGAIDGWRFTVADSSGARTPRALPAFDDLCGDTPAKDGTKRVGVVLDFGRIVDGDGTTQPPDPIGTCAQVAPEATGAEVLADAAASTRIEGGLVCAISDYPASGCGGEVPALTAEQQAPDTEVTLTPGTTPTETPAPTTAAPDGADSPDSTGSSDGTSDTSDSESTEDSINWVTILVWAAVAVVVLFAITRFARRRSENV
ncbi:MAG: hypothetical protein CSA84_05555 [Actinomycetales bacterium]|nr:MAG: hypothetical protein CSA84_05555 [Actinomycetales bacterium]